MTGAREAGSGAVRPAALARLRSPLMLALIAGLVISVEANLVRFVHLVAAHGRGGDFALYDWGARVGRARGWTHLYDSSLVGHPLLGFGAHLPALLTPPPMILMVLPLSYLPYALADAVWMLLLGALLAIAFALAAPAGRWRMPYLLALAGLYPIAYTLFLGQSSAVVAAALLFGWWLMRRHRHLAAGLVLSLICVKPQLVILLPIALLVARRWRTLVGWAVGAAVLAGGSVAAIGWGGVQQYLGALRAPHAAQESAYTLAGILGHGPWTLAVQVAVVALALLVAARSRREPGVVLAAAVIASAVMAPYWHFQDYLALVAVAAIQLAARPGMGAALIAAAMLLTGSPLLAGAAYVPAQLQVALWPAIEAVWIVWLAWPVRGARESGGAGNAGFRRLAEAPDVAAGA
ncbi:MAG: glycosyltransferase family 87 protein [Candidatus Dormibacteraceae bacterium]